MNITSMIKVKYFFGRPAFLTHGNLFYFLLLVCRLDYSPTEANPPKAHDATCLDPFHLPLKHLLNNFLSIHIDHLSHLKMH